MISIRGNKKVALLERRCKDSIPEKLSRSKLLERAVEKASEKNDWDRAYELLKSLKAAQYEDILVADFFQAHLDEDVENQYDELKREIAEACSLSRIRNDFAWQMLLANLLVQNSQDSIPYSAGPIHGKDSLMVASQVDAIRLVGTLTRLLETERPDDSDYAALAKVSAVLGDWEAGRQYKSEQIQ